MSPKVPVQVKPDNTVHFCNDFIKVLAWAGSLVCINGADCLTAIATPGGL